MVLHRAYSVQLLLRSLLVAVPQIGVDHAAEFGYRRGQPVAVKEESPVSMVDAGSRETRMGGNEERMAPRKARPTVYPVKSSGSNSHKGLQHVEHVGQGSQCLIDFADVLIFQRHDYPSPCSTLLFRLGHQAVVDVVQLFALQQRQENAI